MPSPVSNRILHVLPVAVVVLLLGFLTYVVVYKAWLSDDAYITFRTIDNWVQGYGLRWNPIERVQVYTHPLWMLLVSGLYRLTGEFYYTSIVFSTVLTLGASMFLVFRVASSWHAASLGIALFVSSRAFTDYSTSGLENPLTHLLLVLFLWVCLRGEPRVGSTVWASVLAALLLTIRMDLAILLLPVLLLLYAREKRSKVFWAAGLGFLPFLLWEGFSLLYYGSFVPNTAYAKLQSGIPTRELVRQGLFYLENSLQLDPITLLCVGAAITVPFFRWNPRSGAVAIGLVLYVLYLVRIGGDFMSGRFLTAPFCVAVVLVTRSRLRPALAWVACAGITLVCIAVPRYSFQGRESAHASDHIDAHGIADERLHYERFSSLRHARGKSIWPHPKLAMEAAILRESWQRDEFVPALRRIDVLSVRDPWPARDPSVSADVSYRPLLIRGGIGFLGFYLGPEMHVLDFHALTDPLLARQPALVPDPILALINPRLGRIRWRIGHFARRIPEGYPGTLSSGVNQIRDPEFAARYDAVARVTQGPLLNRARLRAIWDLHRGRYAIHPTPRATSR